MPPYASWVKSALSTRYVTMEPLRVAAPEGPVPMEEPAAMLPRDTGHGGKQQR